MIFILEGMDNTGKDTQIKNIQQFIIENNIIVTTHILKYETLPANDFIAERSYYTYVDMFSICEPYATNRDLNIFLNRAHIGEMVYGYIYRNYNAEWIFEIESYYDQIIDNAILIVLIDSSLKCVTEREDGKSLSLGNLENAKLECERFTKAYEMSNIKNKLLIDICNKSADDVKNEILLKIPIILSYN